MINWCKEYFLKHVRTRLLNPKANLKLGSCVPENTNWSIWRSGNTSFEEKLYITDFWSSLK